MSFTAQLVIHCNCFRVIKFNSKYHFTHILLIIFCNGDRDQMLRGNWHVFLYVILFNCKISNASFIIPTLLKKRRGYCNRQRRSVRPSVRPSIRHAISS